MTITFRYGLAAWLAVLVHQAALAQAFPSRSISLLNLQTPSWAKAIAAAKIKLDCFLGPSHAAFN